MIQVFEEQERPSVGQRFARSFAGAAKAGAELIPKHMQQAKQMREENEALKQMGIDLAGINDPELRKILVQGHSKQKEDKNMSFDVAEHALDTMEELMGSSGTGLLGQYNPSESARENRGRMEAAQAAVLPLFKAMFPRGFTEREFKYINEHYVPQVGDTEAKRKGKISELRKMLKDLKKGHAPSLKGIENKEEEAVQEKPSLDSFFG